MILRARDLTEVEGRRAYPLPEGHDVLAHFVTRVTLPGNPFQPHSHEGRELWFIQEGEAAVILDGEEHLVAGGDLIVIQPGVEHGLQSESRVKWICLA